MCCSGGHETPVGCDRLQPGPGEPDHRFQPQHRHPGHHHTAEDRQWEQRGPPHETDLLLCLWDFGWVQGGKSLIDENGIRKVRFILIWSIKMFFFMTFVPSGGGCSGHQCPVSEVSQEAQRHDELLVQHAERRRKSIIFIPPFLKLQKLVLWFWLLEQCGPPPTRIDHFCHCRAASSTSGLLWTASSASSRRTLRAKRRAWPICVSSSRTVSTQCWPPRSCTCWAKRGRGPRSPLSTSASSSTGWCWRARRFVQVRQHKDQRPRNLV